MSAKITKIVLDAQGVTFNAPLKPFLGKLADELLLDKDQLIKSWYEEYRETTWLGKIDDVSLVSVLTHDRIQCDDFFRRLEQEYQPGPMAEGLPYLASRWSVYMLSNHRSHWLNNRLARFNYRKYFEDVFVSDLIGYLKPHEKCFELLLDRDTKPENILFVDDQVKNTEIAKAMGINTFLLEDETSIDEIHSFLNQIEYQI